MRLNEILNERIAISLVGDKAYSALKKQLPTILNAFIKKAGTELPFYALKADQDAKYNNIEGRARVVNFVGHNSAAILSKVARTTTEPKKDNYGLGSPIHVQFSNDLNADAGGTYKSQHNSIVIRPDNVMALGKKVYEHMIDSFINNGFTFVDDVFDGSEFFWDQYLKPIVSIFTHELTHGEQWSRSSQKLGDKNDVYTSYAVPKQKFYKLLAQELRTLENNEAYYSSPQEIDAFAQQFVYDTLQDMADENDESKLAILNDFLGDSEQKLAGGLDSNLKYSRYGAYKDSTNPAVQKARKRFMKKVYQEFDYRRDVIKQSLKGGHP